MSNTASIRAAILAYNEASTLIDAANGKLVSQPTSVDQIANSAQYRVLKEMEEAVRLLRAAISLAEDLKD
jgi:hypothetical protein